MRIDPVTFQVDMTSNTHPVYVWEAPVRVWHWAMAVCMFVMIATGFIIGNPLNTNVGDTWSTYSFAYVRFLHFAAGFIYAGLFVYRVWWMIPGNRYSRMIFFPPFLSLKWWIGIVRQALYYLFVFKTSDEYVGHNPLAQIAMFFFFVIGSIVIMITGFALYAQAYGDGTPWMVAFGWVFNLCGDAQFVRTLHHVTMYYLIIFTMAHLYMSFREDVMGGCTTISSMTTGLRMFKRDRTDFSEIAAHAE